MSPTLYGMKVVVSPLLAALPKIRIPDSFEWCSDEFRASHNAWLLERFGMNEESILVSEHLGCVFVSPAALLELQAGTQAQYAWAVNL